MSNTILIILFFTLAILAVIFFRKRKTQSEVEEQSDRPPSNEKAAATHGDKAAAAPDDKLVLDQLREAGSDLSKPHDLDFYLYFPTEEAGLRAAEKLEGEGYEGELKRSANDSSWLCLVRKRMVPELKDVSDIGRRLRSLAKEFKGEYDGWETRVEK